MICTDPYSELTPEELAAHKGLILNYQPDPEDAGETLGELMRMDWAARLGNEGE